MILFCGNLKVRCENLIILCLSYMQPNVLGRKLSFNGSMRRAPSNTQPGKFQRHSIDSFLKNILFIYLFLERGKGGRKRGRETSIH